MIKLIREPERRIWKRETRAAYGFWRSFGKIIFEEDCGDTDCRQKNLGAKEHDAKVKIKL